MFKEYIEENNIWFLNFAIWNAGHDGLEEPGILGLVGIGNTRLLNEQGEMCCLGQRCEQLGVPRKYLENLSSPHQLQFSKTDAPGIWNLLRKDSLLAPDVTDLGSLKDPEWQDSPLSARAISINDSFNIPTVERLQKLRELLAYHGKTLVVFNYYDNALLET